MLKIKMLNFLSDVVPLVTLAQLMRILSLCRLHIRNNQSFISEGERKTTSISLDCKNATNAKDNHTKRTLLNLLSN